MCCNFESHGTECIDDEQFVRRQIFLPHMSDPLGSVASAFGFPSQFRFSRASDGRRVESVHWSKCCTSGETHALGKEKEAIDKLKKSQKGPLPLDKVPQYAGFFEANVGLIRGTSQDVANDDRGCTPGVFEVEHAPENDVEAHSHIELMPGFLQALQVQAGQDGQPLGLGQLTEKNGRVHAINMLVHLFESGEFVVPTSDNM